MGVKIESIGIYENVDEVAGSSLELIRKAALDCIARSNCDKNEIDVLINVSLYRDNYFAEPAFATFVQNDLGINHDIKTCSAPRTFAFDLMNGAMGFLNACQLISTMIIANKAKTGLVVSGDMVDLPLNESGHPPGFCVTGAAILLGYAPNANNGFGPFFFKKFIDYIDVYDSYMFYENKKLSILFKKALAIEEVYLEAVSRGVSEFLTKEGCNIDDFHIVLPPQVSPGFVAEVADVLGGNSKNFIDVTRKDGDLFNASLPMSMGHVFKNGLASPGQRSLIISVGSGIQVGCAIYNF